MDYRGLLDYLRLSWVKNALSWISGLSWIGYRGFMVSRGLVDYHVLVDYCRLLDDHGSLWIIVH